MDCGDVAGVKTSVTLQNMAFGLPVENAEFSSQIILTSEEKLFYIFYVETSHSWFIQTSAKW